MTLFEKGIQFIISNEYKLIIPQLDINKCNIDLFDKNTINEWRLFVNKFDDDFDKAVKKLKRKKYKIIQKYNLFIKIPYDYKSCIWENHPDLYNCTGDQVLLYLEKTQLKLSDIFIRTSPNQHLVNCNITPETFPNLSISDYTKLVEIMIKNDETNITIWCSIACWWNYSTQTVIQSVLERKPGIIENWIEKNENRKKDITTELSFKNDEIWIKILNNYCCPKIFTRCNWFLMLHSRAKLNGSTEVINWISEHKKNVIWDEDLLSDTPNFAFNECYEYYLDNEIIINELGKRFLPNK